MTTPTTQREADERAMYEEHARQHNVQLTLDIDGKDYHYPLAKCGWSAWQARAAIDQSTRPIAPEAPAAATDQPTAGQVRELLPCPFCGGAARIESNRDWHRLYCAHDDDCALDADDADLMYPAQPGYLLEIAEVWNRRASLTPTAPQAASPAEPVVWASETGWLIEVKGFQSPLWLKADGSTTADANDALRFGREQDASAFLSVFLTAKCGDDAVAVYKRRLGADCYTVTEHIWHSDAAPQAASQQAELVHQMRSLTGHGKWHQTDADGATSITRMPHWADLYEFRTLQVIAPQAATTASVNKNSSSNFSNNSITEQATKASAGGEWVACPACKAVKINCPRCENGMVRAIAHGRAALARAPLPAQQVQAVDVSRDAARYRVLRLHVMPGDVRLAMTQLPPKAQTPPDRIDLLCDIEISRTNTSGGSNAD